MLQQWIDTLNHSDPARRYEAAQRLGAANDTRAVAPLSSALRDPSDKVQYAAFSGLIKLDRAQAAEPLAMALLDTPNSRLWELLKLNIGMRLRAGMLTLLERLEPSRAVLLSDRLIDALNQPAYTEPQRALFVRMLGRAGDLSRIDALMRMAQDDTFAMRSAAAEALGYLRDRRAVEPLLSCLNDATAPNDDLREIAAEALGRIGDTTAFDALMSSLSDESEWVRRAAAVALGDLGDERAMNALGDRLQDESTTVQDAAFEAIKKLSSARYTTTIQQ